MRITSLEDRVAICTLSAAGHSDLDISQRLGWEVPTMRKWRRRGQREGRPGLGSKVGRPATGEMSTFPPVVQETVRAMRRTHPDWGPKTLRTELEYDPSLASQRWPGRSTIARWLKEQELTRPNERHQDLPQPAPAPPRAPHEEWEMDARGYDKVAGVGVVNLINLNDRFSVGPVPRVRLPEPGPMVPQSQQRRDSVSGWSNLRPGP